MTDTDLSRIVRFNGPHPGFLGAARPLPTQMKNAADSLDGKVMTLGDGLAALEPASQALGGELKIDKNHAGSTSPGGVILFWIPDPPTYVGHMYRLIHYEER